MNKASNKFLIAICSRGENPNLTNCIQRLVEIRNQSIEKIEIVIVLNSERINFQFDQSVHVVTEKKKGYVHVRNRALEFSDRDSVIIFIDDDELPTQLWFDELVVVHRKFPQEIIGGPVFPKSQNIYNSYRSKSHKEYSRLIDCQRVHRVGAGNMLIPPYVKNELGMRFNPEFNRDGGEDTEYCFHARSKGCFVRFALNAVLYEIEPEGRFEEDYIRRRFMRETVNYSVITRMHGTIIQNIFRGFKLFIRLSFELSKFAIGRDDAFKFRVYLLSIKALFSGKLFSENS